MEEIVDERTQRMRRDWSLSIQPPGADNFDSAALVDAALDSPAVQAEWEAADVLRKRVEYAEGQAKAAWRRALRENLPEGGDAAPDDDEGRRVDHEIEQFVGRWAAENLAGYGMKYAAIRAAAEADGLSEDDAERFARFCTQKFHTTVTPFGPAYLALVLAEWRRVTGK